MRGILGSLLIVVLPGLAWAQTKDGNRLAYLDEVNPYYPSRTFPKLITPQWVGEPGVEAVVILAIDDMRNPKQYEAFLRPILRRLGQIDGRAPLSIMTNSVDPKDPQLQAWLKEGLSIECHTIDHPCPFFKGGFDKAKKTYDDCVDLMNEIPNNKPVAFRMPCCDSLNTPSPRFYAEIFNKTTKKGNFLSIDTSVFNVFTANDPELPRELVLNADGTERFRKYLPVDRSFVNTIEDYPYPYVIGRLCWQFPCVVPSDWEAQHLQKPNNPQTVKDWKAVLDCTVIKKGVFCLVFHPHGWIRNDQVVEFVEYAVQKYGKKVKFMTFKEALERLNKNMLADRGLRHINGGDNGVRLLDLNNDGYLDRVIESVDVNRKVQVSRTFVWHEREGWVPADSLNMPIAITSPAEEGDRLSIQIESGLRFGVVDAKGFPCAFARFSPYKLHPISDGWTFNGRYWLMDFVVGKGLPLDKPPAREPSGSTSVDPGFRLLDLDGDGTSEWILAYPKHQAIYAWSRPQKRWNKLPFVLPDGVSLVDRKGRGNGFSFLDLDGDGKLDIIFSNEKEYGIYLFNDMKTGWTRKVMAGKRSDPDALPMISRNGTNNGVWVHSGSLWWANEDTMLLKDHVDRRSINDLLKNVEPRALSPQASLKAIKPRPGFTVELMVSEPLVQSPIAFAWGPDGKFWVVEMGDYPLGVDGKGKPGGRVKFLEKTKSDGPYDKMTVFMDGLPFPTGVMPWGKGVLVTCAPDIFYAEDTDGDGKADKKIVLFTGFVEGNQQHRVNGLSWGLDNWVYGANGDSGGIIRPVHRTDGKAVNGELVNISGRDFRIKPDEGLIEAVTGQSQYGRCRDDWGNWFGCNNGNPFYHFVLDDHYLRRNPHLIPPDPRVNVSVTPGAARVYPASRTLPRFNSPGAENHFTSACSCMIYRDDLFGPAFANNTFVSEPVHNLIHREIMKPKGVTFTSRRAPDEQTSEFLASTDNWFRPTMIQTGPDGAIWVADMYRHVIEHPEWIPKEWQKKLDLRAGHDKGRIYRIYPVDKKPRAIPRLDKLDTAGLVAALDSASGWQQDTVQQMLMKKRDKSLVEPLVSLAKASNRPEARLHALCTLDGMGAFTSEMSFALDDPHAGVRRHAVRLCYSEQLVNEPMRLSRFLSKEGGDPDPQVRLQLAYALGASNDRGGELGRLALANHKDPYLLAAIMSSVTPKNLGDVMGTVVRPRSGPVPAVVLEKLLILGNAFGSREALATLFENIAAERPYQFLALAGILDALESQNSSLSKLWAHADDNLKQSLKRLSRLYVAARKIVADPKAAQSEQVLAIRILGRGLDHYQEDLTTLTGLLVPQTSQELQAAAANSLSRIKDPSAPTALLKNWKGYAPSLRSQVLDALLSRQDGVRATLDMLERKTLLPLEIDAARRQRLLDYRDPAIRKRAAKLLAGATDPDRRKVVDDYLAQVKDKGDPALGAKIFTKTCAACHQLGGIGQQVGPDLGSIADKSTPALLNAILDPNQAVEARYVNYVAVTKNGLTITGLLASETGTSITLVGPDGKSNAILRTDLEELASTGKSVMPEGLEKDVSPADMTHLLAFIRKSLPPTPRKVFPGNEPQTIRPAADGAFHLLASNCEVYGKTLIFEQQYKNLGYWTSADDHAVWTVDVPRAGKYAVHLDWACDNGSAGNTFTLQARQRSLTVKVQGTGTWDDYRQARIGTIELDAGRQQILMRPAGAPGSPMIDLKSVLLKVTK
jgi:putative membrane-bound dehydrogenase-like protein